MTKSENELSKLKTSAIRKKQTLDVIRLRIPYGDMSVYQRMQTEIFLKDIRMMADNLSQIESYNDILAALLVENIFHLTDQFIYTISSTLVSFDLIFREILPYLLGRNSCLFTKCIGVNPFYTQGLQL